MAWFSALALRRRGHDVDLIVGSPPPDKISNEVPTVVVSDVEDIGAAVAKGVDVVHTFDLVDPRWANVAGSVAGHFGAVHAITPSTDISLWEDLELGVRTCRDADALFVLTSAERRSLVARGVRQSSLVPIGQGADIPDGANAAAWRDRHNVQGPVVLFLGRVVRFKGWHHMLAAAPLVWKSRPDTTFVLAGPTIDDDRTQLVEAFGDRRILDLGEIELEEKADALAAADILCLPSVADVFPLVFVEAWLSRCAVLTGPFLGADEIVRPGIDGLVSGIDPTALSEALLTLLDGETAARFGAAGFDRAANEFTWEAVARKLEAQYLHCLTRGRRGPKSLKTTEKELT